MSFVRKYKTEYLFNVEVFWNNERRKDQYSNNFYKEMTHKTAQDKLGAATKPRINISL